MGKVFFIWFHKMKTQKNNHTVGTVPRFKLKIVENGKNNTLKKHIRSLSWLGTDTSINMNPFSFFIIYNRVLKCCIVEECWSDNFGVV